VTAHNLSVHSSWNQAFGVVDSRAWLAMVMLMALGLAGCGGGSSGGDDARPVASIVVSPAAPEMTVGGSVQLTAAVLDSSGRTLTGHTVTWSSQDATILAVSASGLVTAHQPGSTRITASAGGKTGFAHPVVSEPVPAAVAHVVISPASDVLEEGADRQLTATVYDADDNVLTGRGIAWTSQDKEIANVDPGGVVTALRPGITTISAKVEGKTAAAAIRVEAHYPFELLYRHQVEGGAADLYTLDINDPAAVAMPVFQDGPVALQPAASPDGSRIAFVVPAAPGAATWPGTAIYTAKRDGSDVKVLISDGQVNEQPAWSPDGNVIVFRRQSSGSNSDIWVMKAADGSDAVNLTALHGDAGQSSPAWSPVLGDGTTRIAYVQSDQGQLQIWTMRSDGSDPRRTTFSATADDDQPAWSPDGQTLVFQRSDAAVFGDLYVVNAAGGDGAALRPAAPLAGPQHRPQWSPDGKLIAFASRHEGDFYQIYTVWSDGSRLARRTFGEVHHVHPAWLSLDDGS
jgi:dipeptidyl aminopeptidase/acylaminoacyl peptidase